MPSSAISQRGAISVCAFANSGNNLANVLLTSCYHPSRKWALRSRCLVLCNRNPLVRAVLAFLLPIIFHPAQAQLALPSTFLQTSNSINADSDGLMLMAHVGYHPDFMFSLHNLLRDRAVETAHSTVDALHPEWTSREEALRTIYASAGHEYERLLLEISDSPGGIPLLLFQRENSSPANEMSAGKKWLFHYAAAT